MDLPRSPKPLLLWAIAAAGLVAAGGTFALAFTGGRVADPAVHSTLIGWITLPYVLTGVVAWWRRPGSRFGPLMIAAGFATFVVSIGGIGLSVGGEMLIRAAAGSDAFKAIVAEGASGQSLRDGIANGEMSATAILADGSITLATALFTNELPPPSLKSEVAKIAPTAVFFVYGEKGQNGSETKPNRGFYAAAREPKQIWEVPNGQHIAGITTEPAEYERRVVGFFHRTLLGAAR